MRHKGGGHKQHYRIVDFKRNKDGSRGQGRAARVRPEPQRATSRCCSTPTASAATSSRRAASRSARCCSRAPKRRSSRATACRCATFRSARRSTASRCSRARVRRSRARPAPRCSFSRAKASTRSCGLRSGEIRKVHVDCRATIGEVGNEEHSLRSIGKAGANRWRGIRPTVRGDLDESGRPPAWAVAPTAAADGITRYRRGARRPRATRRARTSAPIR